MASVSLWKSKEMFVNLNSVTLGVEYKFGCHLFTEQDLMMVKEK
jgi:hypothetical protein